MAGKKKRSKTISPKKKISENLAIVCLLLNIIILPGLGSLIGNKKKQGILQLILFVLGIPLSLILIGIPMILGAWIWAIVTGINLIKESHK
jgi:TM2 domain-containing membrane protein YozV